MLYEAYQQNQWQTIKCVCVSISNFPKETILVQAQQCSENNNASYLEYSKLYIAIQNSHTHKHSIQCYMKLHVKIKNENSELSVIRLHNTLFCSLQNTIHHNTQYNNNEQEIRAKKHFQNKYILSILYIYIQMRFTRNTQKKIYHVLLCNKVHAKPLRNEKKRK